MHGMGNGSLMLIDKASFFSIFLRVGNAADFEKRKEKNKSLVLPRK